MKAMVVILLTVSVLFLRMEIKVPNLWTNKAWIKAVLGVVLLTAYAFMWKWDRTILTSGLNVYFGGGSAVQESLTATPTVKAAEPAKPAEPEESVHKMLSFNENTQGGITTVVETTTKKPSGTTVFHTLFSNGKFQGDDSTQGAAQAGVAVIPSLFTAKFDRALLIGLETGHSGYALRRTGYSNVDIAEFSPGIVKAASTYFRKLNGAVLEDPRVRLAQEDGRNMLLADRSTKYDLITIELTSIWFAGATNLYSREFYELADQRLNPGGVLQQWVQFHHISPAEISSAVATARVVFPYVSLWFFGSQGMIVATHHPQTLDHGRLDDLAQKLSNMSTIKEDLRSSPTISRTRRCLIRPALSVCCANSIL
jgi:spermidine synthase